MAKRTSKAEIILQGARDRVRSAEEGVRNAEWQVTVARAALQAHRDAFTQLETQLAKAARKVKDPKSTAPSAKGKSSKNKGTGDGSASIETVKGTAGDVANHLSVLPDDPEEFQHGVTA